MDGGRANAPGRLSLWWTAGAGNRRPLRRTRDSEGASTVKTRGIILASATFVAAASASAGPITLPHQKPGLWQQTMSRDGKPMGAASLQICLDDAVQSKFTLFSQQMAGKMCHAQSITHNLDGSWSTESDCKVGNGMEAKGHTSVTGDFNRKVVLTTVSETTGAPVAAVNGKHQIVVTSTWLGACKAGQKPGDMMMQNGMKLNILDMANAFKNVQPANH